MEFFMKLPFQISEIAFLGIALAFTACQDMGEPASVNPNGNNGGVSSEGTKTLFSESFSDGGNLQVVSDEAGGIHYMVQSPIGSDAEKLMLQGASQSNLADVYRTLHAGAQNVPDAVLNASEQIEAQKAASPAAPVPVAPVEALSKAGAASSQSAFKNNYCVSFHEGSTRYTNTKCVWSASATSLSTGAALSSNGTLMDKCAGWNNTSFTATMTLSWPQLGVPSPNSWKPTIPAFSAYWIQWGGKYDNAVGKINLPAGKNGEIGITAHVATPNI
jgi:hypothetical protein